MRKSERGTRNGQAIIRSAFAFCVCWAAPPAHLTAQDSAAVVRAARDAQAAFERVRRAYLPFRPSRSGQCDEVIGRFCFWHHDGDSPPPPEAPRIREARAGLLRRLDSAAALLPGDGWIAGQRVRYFVEHGWADSGLAAAQRCGADAWWCAALSGLALHIAGDFAAAETAFVAALDGMPADERCRWTDLSWLLDAPVRGRYRRLSCADRSFLDARLWRLAQPLVLIPGNDRRTEHLARVAMTTILRDARNAYGIRWGDDLAEITVRYGWEVAWTRNLPPPGSTAEPAIAGHQRTPSFHFLPATPDSGWALRARRPRETYGPSYATSFASLRHQAALFRRGDSALVVAVYDLREDALLVHDDVEVALGLVPEGDTTAFVARAADPGEVGGALTVRAPWGPVVVTVEALSRSNHHAARARLAKRPPAPDGPLTVSDLLLFEPSDSSPRSLDDVLPSARGHYDVGPARTVGLFWEVYGLAAGAPVIYSLTVTAAGGGWLRRAVEAVGLAGRPTPVRLRWQEVLLSAGAIAPRGLVIDLSTAGRGRYTIELTVDAPGIGAVTTAREIRLVQGADK